MINYIIIMFMSIYILGILFGKIYWSFIDGIIESNIYNDNHYFYDKRYKITRLTLIWPYYLIISPILLLSFISSKLGKCYGNINKRY